MSNSLYNASQTRNSFYIFLMPSMLDVAVVVFFIAAGGGEGIDGGDIIGVDVFNMIIIITLPLLLLLLLLLFLL